MGSRRWPNATLIAAFLLGVAGSPIRAALLVSMLAA
jgi:hypothetical protein